MDLTTDKKFVVLKNIKGRIFNPEDEKIIF